MAYSAIEIMNDFIKSFRGVLVCKRRESQDNIIDVAQLSRLGVDSFDIHNCLSKVDSVLCFQNCRKNFKLFEMPLCSQFS